MEKLPYKLGSTLSCSAAAPSNAQVHQIFCYLDSISSAEYTVKCSYLELYNEEITDLLVLGTEATKVRRRRWGQEGR